ncbi:MAG: dipeptide epimerase [Pirellulales bacterium]
MELFLHCFDLPLRHVFTISRGSTHVQKTLVVELRQGDMRGYGEAVDYPFYGATIENMTAALEQVRPQLEAADLDDPASLWQRLRPMLGENSFAQCALDCAAYDLWGKLRGQPVWKLWGLSLDRLPPSDYTIGIDAIETMVAKLREFPGWPVYKIKLGTPDDLAIVRQLRKHTVAAFRVDANCAWGVEETIRNAAALAELGVEFIEQPLDPADRDGAQEVFRRSALPIIADESCQRESDVDRALGCFHGINIKLIKCGGLTPARRMIARARELGLSVMVGCMTESTVGISAIAQLLPLLDYADMDGAVLLARDIATGVTIDRGRACYSDENGCGVRLVGLPGRP